jgi:uncharacterized protein YndB with AHSA1/START domain
MMHLLALKLLRLTNVDQQTNMALPPQLSVGISKPWRLPIIAMAFFALSACTAPPTAIVAPPPIVETIVVKAKVAEVWKAWTTKEGIISFFAPDANIEAKVDGAFEVFMNPLAKAGDKGADGMRILALEENAMLTFTWNAPPSMPIARAQRTVVTVRMAARGDSLTDVSLTHTGFGGSPQWLEAHTYFEKAWPNVMKNLKKRFDDGPIDWAPWLKRLQERADATAKPVKK